MLNIYTEKIVTLQGKRYKINDVKGVQTLTEIARIAPIEYFRDGAFMFTKYYDSGSADVIIAEPEKNIKYNYEILEKSFYEFTQIARLSFGRSCNIATEKELEEFLPLASKCMKRLRECLKRNKELKETWKGEKIFIISNNGEITELTPEDDGTALVTGYKENSVKHISAVHFGCEKEYTWKAENVDVKEGDVVEVETDYGPQLVEVKHVFESEDIGHKSVIKVMEEI